MSELLNHLRSIWYHSEPSDVPIPKTSQDQFLGLDFSYSKTTLTDLLIIREGSQNPGDSVVVILRPSAGSDVAGIDTNYVLQTFWSWCLKIR